ncbi:MAG: hypothetical protein V4736_04575 [Bdellovibrionota bacterium]
MRQQTSKFIRVIVSISIALTSLPALPLEIKLNQNMYLRTEAGEYMNRVGKLTKGSVVSIPDEHTVKTNGKIDLSATLKKWGAKSYKYDKNGREKFFPITIVSAAPGSNPKAGTHYMALDFLRRRGNAEVKLDVTKDAPVYSAPAPRPATATPAAGTGSARTEGSDASCTTCREPVTIVPQKVILHEIAERVEPVTVGELVVTAAPKIEYNNFQGFKPSHSACNKFIGRDGQYGEYGEAVLEAINGKQEFLNDNSVRGVCPRFDSFSDAQKKHFWVWIFGSMAEKESGCRNDKPNWKSPNPPAVGLFQMDGNEYQQSVRRSMYGNNSCTGDMTNPAKNIQCAVETMSYFTTSKGKSLVRNSRDQYWQVLHSTRGGTAKMINKYRACHSSGGR